jgi:enamine deaminase RidA (YjgF/YER057c/UK114 family)
MILFPPRAFDLGQGRDFGVQLTTRQKVNPLAKVRRRSVAGCSLFTGAIVTRTDDGFSVSSFTGQSGATEHFIAVDAPSEASLARQIDFVARRYAEALQGLCLTPETAVFRRIFVSDAANQAAEVLASSLCQEPLHSAVAISLVQQPPLRSGKLAMLAYHVQDDAPLMKRQIAPGHMQVHRGELNHVWSTRLCTGNSNRASSAVEQTHAVFARLTDMLAAGGGTLAGNCVRTWLYVKDVDVFYQDLVAARRDLFERHGLTRETHYIASTGIEGACSHRYDVVLMDAYSIFGLRPEQVSYLTATDHLCPTHDYNVTFERGTRIAYADRAHHFISGTASIDNEGRVLHVGDVQHQLDRALDNVDALLRSGGAGIEDMSHFLVYLRDPSDRPWVEACFDERFPDVPRVVVRGPVCRPEWLIEVEGIAVAHHDAPGLPAF